MRKHRLTRGELLLIVAAVFMIGIVAIGAGQRQAAQQAGQPAADALAGASLVEEMGCPLKDAALAALGTEKCDAAAIAAGECDKAKCEQASMLAGGTAEGTCDKAALVAARQEESQPVQEQPVAAVRVAAKAGSARPSAK